MPYTIPEPFCWDESFRVFYETLDDEHKLLFQSVFMVAREPNSQVLSDDLYRVASNHFAEEEAAMTKAKYDGYDEHKNLHEEFLAKLRGFNHPIDPENVQYCKQWLVRHIKNIDFKYKGKLNIKATH